ncbi:hypothetical protein F4808DRAFT_165006 [Astrocystis sublimbata]|nr:hypothetical protein F4808DRAFT_165006 [Astrocystis sublimbata]
MVKSLLELCTAVCLQNIKDITDMGAIPYSVARPILMKVNSAAQLRQIEVNSPQLELETPECWKRLISREFPILAAKYNYMPKNPRSWYKIHAKYQRLDLEAKEAAREKLKNAFNRIESDKSTSVSKVVTYDSRKLPQLPRDVKPQRGMRGKGRGEPDQSSLRWTGGSKTKVNTAKSVLKRAMREAKEISAKTRLDTKAGTRQVRTGQVMRAPVGMVQEKITQARPATGIRPPMRRPEKDARTQELDDREARLRKAKEMTTGGSYVSDDDLDEFDIEGEDGPIGLEVDDLESYFDDREARPSTSVPRGSSSARKMGGSAQAYSSSTRKEPMVSSSSRAQGPTSPPPKAMAGSSSGQGAMLPRKRKAADIFMKAKKPRP